MGDISEHISRHEVACHCGCGMAGADLQLVHVIETCVKHFEEKACKRLGVNFNSWNRCVLHNMSIPGATRGSYHSKGMATDFRISGVTADEVADYLEAQYSTKFGIGRYKGRTHLDVRKLKARWDRR